jgi:hypothetical protein
MGLCHKGVYLRSTPLNFKKKTEKLEKYILQYPFKNLTIIKI